MQSFRKLRLEMDRKSNRRLQAQTAYRCISSPAAPKRRLGRKARNDANQGRHGEGEPARRGAGGAPCSNDSQEQGQHVWRHPAPAEPRARPRLRPGSKEPSCQRRSESPQVAATQARSSAADAVGVKAGRIVLRYVSPAWSAEAPPRSLAAGRPVSPFGRTVKLKSP